MRSISRISLPFCNTLTVCYKAFVLALPLIGRIRRGSVFPTLLVINHLTTLALVVRPDRPVRPSAESDRPVEEHNPTGRSTDRPTPVGWVDRTLIAGIFRIDGTPVGRIAAIEADLAGGGSARFRARRRTASWRGNLGESEVGMAGADTVVIELRRLPNLRVWLQAKF